LEDRRPWVERDELQLVVEVAGSLQCNKFATPVKEFIGFRSRWKLCQKIALLGLIPVYSNSVI